MSVQVDEHRAETTTHEPTGPGPATRDAGPDEPADGGQTHLDRDAVIARLRARVERIVAPVVVLVTAVWIIGPNLTHGPAKEALGSLWRPAVVLGLDQDWRVFTPNPVDQSVEVFAVVDLADGSQVEWHAPERDVVLGAYTEYRWQKWQERVRLDERADLWAPTARWIADGYRADGLVPVRVRLVRRWIVHLPLTAQGVDDGDWQESAFFEFIPEAG